MRGIKAAILLSAFAILAWALLDIGQQAAVIWPAWKLAHVGAAGACLYVVFDLLDRWREFLGWRGGERRTYRRAWGPWR